MKKIYKLYLSLSLITIILITQSCDTTSPQTPQQEPVFRLFIQKIQSHQNSKNSITIEPIDSNTNISLKVSIGSLIYKDTVITSKTNVEFTSGTENSTLSVASTTSSGKLYQVNVPIEIVPETLPEMVLIDDSLWVSTAEVTQKLWNSVMTENRSEVIGEQYPIEKVSWYDAVEFCNALSISKGFSPFYNWVADTIQYDFQSKGFRMPFETEWKRYTLNGAVTDLFNGTLENKDCTPVDPLLDKVAWYCGNTTFVQKVKRKMANDFGLYDVHGNVWEWCNDWVFPHGDTKLLKGGSWYNSGFFTTQFNFYNLSPTERFRIYSFRVIRNK